MRLRYSDRQKIKVPVFKGIEYSGKVIYFADRELSRASKSIEEEFRLTVYDPCESDGVRFTNVKCSYDNPIYPNHEYYEILFFDYGGMDDSNMLDSFSRTILSKYEEFPNRLYCMVSNMTSDAMKELLVELKIRPANVFLEMEELCSFLKNGMGS